MGQRRMEIPQLDFQGVKGLVGLHKVPGDGGVFQFLQQVEDTRPRKGADRTFKLWADRPTFLRVSASGPGEFLPAIQGSATGKSSRFLAVALSSPSSLPGLLHDGLVLARFRVSGRASGWTSERANPLNSRPELALADRLGDVAVHACSQTALAVPFHDMCRQGDDRHVFQVTRSLARTGPSPSPAHAGHLKSISTRSIPVAPGAPVPGGRRRQCSRSNRRLPVCKPPISD